MKKTLFLMVAGGLVSVTQAMVVEQNRLDAALNNADAVVEIKVRAVERFPDPVLQCVYRATATVLRVLEIRRPLNSPPSVDQSIVFSGPGCEVNGQGVLLSGYPRPYVGHRYQAFLNEKSNGEFGIAGLEKGFLPLDRFRSYSRNRTDGSNGNGQGPFLFWNDSYFPISYFIALPTFTGHQDYVSAIDAAFKTWRSIENVRVEFTGLGCSMSRRNENDGLNNVILIDRNWPFDSGAIAITRNFYVAGDGPNSGMILDSDILLNAVDYQFTTTGELGKHDVQNIVTHEVGHFLGMGHEVSPTDPDATMYSVASTGELKKRDLRPNDLGGIRAAYPGPGIKLSFRSPSCNVLDRAAGCGAVHRARTSPWGWIAFISVMGLNLLVGRLWRKQNLCRPQ